LSNNPRSILSLPMASIEIGNKADLTLFAPQQKWIFTKEMVCSNTFNSDLIGKELTGKTVGVIHNNSYYLKN